MNSHTFQQSVYKGETLQRINTPGLRRDQSKLCSVLCFEVTQFGLWENTVHGSEL